MTALMDERGVLLFGYGLAGRVFHAPLISCTPGLAIRAVVTSNAERQAQVRHDLPDVRIVDDPDMAWDDLDDIDLVVIAGANRTHLPLALAAAQHGMSMVIDKPIAGTAEDARRIAAAASLASVQVHAFQNRRWDSEFLTLRSVAESGEIGALHRLESRFDRFRTTPRSTWRESTDPEDLGGVLLDFGAHLVDQAIELLGPVRTVSASARCIRGAGEDDMRMVLTHTSGAESLLVGSQASALAGPRFLLLARMGAVRIDEADTQETELRIGRTPRDAAWGQEAFMATLRVMGADDQLVTREQALVPGNWGAFYPAVLESLTTGAAGPVPLHDVIANLEVLDAARASATSGLTVALRAPAGHA